MNYDVIVAGAGLAGLHCARLLGSAGVRVLLLDRKTSLCEGVHTTGIFVRKTLEDFPLPDEQLGPPLRNVTLYSPARRPLHLIARQDEFRVGRMAWIYLYLLDQCGRNGVTWLPAARLISSEAATNGMMITIERNGHRQRHSARFVIGADGARSTTAQHLGLDSNSEFLIGIEDVFASAHGKPALHCYLDPRLAPGYIGWVVDDGEEAHAGVAGYRDRFNPAEALDAFLDSIRSQFGFHKRIERRGGLIPVNGILPRICNERGLLIGDAAGAVSPLTAGGLDAAMRLSSFAAEVVRAYLDSGDREVLAQFNGDRFRARFVARRWMRRAMRAFEHPLLMEVGCAMLRMPPLRAFAHHLFFSRGGSFPEARLAWPVSSRA